MEKERIMPYIMAHKLNEKDLQEVSASGTTISTSMFTYISPSESDISIDEVTDA